MSQQLAIKAAMRSADAGRLAEQIQRLERGGIDALHFDVMDGRFVPELYSGPAFIRALRHYTRLPFEVHLLVEEPDRCLDQYLDIGVDCLLVHVEATAHPAATLERIRQRGMLAGLATTPGTSASSVMPFLELCNILNVMTV
ncbi:MAG: ribulose-phosphate 3-epimerase, partial [Candidatus Omnitrophota bacterium]|nr:ribulose-phosphate 3-epimerase [Candidatus Omnitrophota bacterium]